MNDEQRWVPGENDHVRWSNDPQPGRVWRVLDVLVGDPRRYRIVPEAIPGAGVQTGQPRIAGLDELEPAF